MENVTVVSQHVLIIHPVRVMPTAVVNGVRVESVIVLLLPAWKERSVQMPPNASQEGLALTESAIVNQEVAKTTLPA